MSAIDSTTDDPLYQSERWGMTAYRFTVPNGLYQVVLKFAEIYQWATVGSRVFDVKIEGKAALTSFDIMAATGGRYKALDYETTATVQDGVLDIEFVRRTGNPKISAIAVTFLGP
jgi:hypothetical protein